MKSASSLVALLTLGGLLASATAVQAQSEPKGFYASIYTQASRLGSTTFDEFGSAGFGSGLEARFKTGMGLGGDIGYRYGNGWATEFEWNWPDMI